ncbi:MAG: hypothetical protein JSR09_00265 [Bacteroidetes bacterium]|nr:hypothetical protein [Bacteroidota bacterium]MBS1648117.1 hypothetical protein [Bacteroidota bacterium]
MKKILLFFAIIITASFTLSSCTKTVQAPSQTYAVTGTITPTNWISTGTGGYVVSLNVPDITQSVLNAGGVSVSISFDGGNTYEALPEVVNGVAYGTYYSYGTVNIDLFAATGSGSVSAPTSTILVKILITTP